MKNRLIIDPQLAAQEISTVFDGDWSWPVSQPEYDDPITEFIKWSDEFHKEIGDSHRLLSAFLLIKSDLLKDLSYYASAWIDIASAKRTNTEVVFHPNQYIYHSLISNEFGNILPIERYRQSLSIGIRAKFRARLSRFKRTRINKRTLSGTQHTCYLIGGNSLSMQISPDKTPVLRLTADDIAGSRPVSSNLPDRLIDTARQISEAFVSIISQHSTPPSNEFTAHVEFIASQYLCKGWIDIGQASIFPPRHPSSKLITGTGGGYLARLVSYQFLSEGHSVLRTSHGGENPLFNDVLWPSIDLPFASKYILGGDVAANAVNIAIRERSESQVPNYTKSAAAVGSVHHAQILARANAHTRMPVKNISVISASFTGIHRVTPHLKLHDVVYMEWHRRLLQNIRNLGYRVISKRHPKGLIMDQAIFRDVADEELLSTSMDAIEPRTDAYVIDFPASALMESICTLKPVILIDLPIRIMRPEARARLSKSVEIIAARYDDRNRVAVDKEQLKASLEKPVDIDARKQLIQDYLLNPSPDVDLLFE